MKQYLIHCEYEIYNQGYESAYGYFLVSANSFEEACEKLKRKLKAAENFVNCTVD